MPTVTRLREDRRGRVAVELDGAPWRVLPVDVVARAGLSEGRTLDRETLRTVRRELRRVEAIGNRVRVKVVKNKVAPPFKQAEFDIIYGSGISWEGTVLDAGLERKVVQKSGSYFSFDEERLGQGRQNATAFLREHPDVCQGILQKIQLELGPEQVASARLLPAADLAETNGKVQAEPDTIGKAAAKTK